MKSECSEVRSSHYFSRKSCVRTTEFSRETMFYKIKYFVLGNGKCLFRPPPSAYSVRAHSMQISVAKHNRTSTDSLQISYQTCAGSPANLTTFGQETTWYLPPVPAQIWDESDFKLRGSISFCSWWSHPVSPHSLWRFSTWNADGGGRLHSGTIIFCFEKYRSVVLFQAHTSDEIRQKYENIHLNFWKSTCQSTIGWENFALDR